MHENQILDIGLKIFKERFPDGVTVRCKRPCGDERATGGRGRIGSHQRHINMP
jgi:hypothetical protein